MTATVNVVCYRNKKLSNGNYWKIILHF